MLRNGVVNYCAPTLAGIKTGNIFSMRNEADEMNAEVRDLNRILTRRGLRLIPVRRVNKRTLYYLYRPEHLSRDLNDPEAKEILSKKGYPCGNADCCLVELVRHLMSDEEFPHEIGLFLGYPPSDVRGFMNSACEGVKCSGCWKVYSNEQEAKKTFERFEKCQTAYRNEIKKGKSLEELIVDTRRDVRLAI